jgi:hypothetical protein
MDPVPGMMMIPMKAASRLQSGTFLAVNPLNTKLFGSVLPFDAAG